MKKNIAVVAVVILLAAGYYFISGKPGGPAIGSAVAKEGIVVEVDVSQARYDGPYVVKARTKEGEAFLVTVPTMGLPMCPAYQAKNIGDVTLFKPGDEIEVRGLAVSTDGTNSINPCDSAEYYLRPTPLVVKDFEGEADPARMTLAMKTWDWISANYNDGKKVTPQKPGRFTLTFSGDGKIAVGTDCNSGGGTYTVGKDKTIKFTQMLSTLMYCEGSQESEFWGLLDNVSSYHFTSKGELIFDLKFDSGTVTFR